MYNNFYTGMILNKSYLRLKIYTYFSINYS